MSYQGRWHGWHEGVTLAMVVAVGAVYAAAQLDQGWVPHDEGMLGQSALRVLRGEMPHMHFDAVYTGGLALLNAVAFKLGGVQLVVPRLVLWTTFLLWIPVAYWITRRFAEPIVCSVAVLLMVAWSVPNYPAAVPSWYNLFLATFGAAGLLQYLETGRKRWLVVAGVCGGVSVLFKIAGIYFIAAGILLLILVEQTEVPELHDAADLSSPEGGSPVYRMFILGPCVVGTFLLAWIVAAKGGPEGAVYLVLPMGCLIAFLVWTESSVASASSRLRFRRLIRLAGPFLAGAILPLAAFLLPYAVTGTLDELARGLFVIPARRFAKASYPMTGALMWVVGLAYLSPLGLVAVGGSRIGWGVATVAAGVGGWILFTGDSLWAYWLGWSSIRPLVPLLVVCGTAVLFRRTLHAPRSNLDVMSLATFGIFAVVAFCSLIQFPYSMPIYFMYVGPLAVLGFLALVRLIRPLNLPATLVLILLCFQLFFAVRWLNTGFITTLGRYYAPSPQIAELELPRASLRVAVEEKAIYERLVARLNELSRGPYIYAGPDSPEVYFLAHRRNPTRALFEFLSVDQPKGEPFFSMLREHGVTVVAINRNPSFSDPLDEITLEVLRRQYPRTQAIGDFLLMWR